MLSKEARNLVKISKLLRPINKLMIKRASLVQLKSPNGASRFNRCKGPLEKGFSDKLMIKKMNQVFGIRIHHLIQVAI